MTAGDDGVEAGWYRQKDGSERYWDGFRWTDKYRGGDEPPPNPADRSPDDLSEEDPEDDSSPPPESLWDKAVPYAVVGVVLLVLGCCGWAFSYEGEDDADSSGVSITACHDAVKQQIKNPSTADFSWLEQTVTDSSVSGELTAQNDFGAEKTLRYHCTISGSTVTDVKVNQL